MKLIVIKLSAYLALSVLMATALAAGESSPQTVESPYQIVEGKVDQETYSGWRVFHSACHGCHGEDATGTSVAPNLVDRISDMKAKDFVATVLERYRIVLPSAEMRGDDTTALRRAFVEQVLKHERGELIMPTWRVDPNVKPHVMDIYGYLKARADGELGPGKPERIE